MHKPLKPLMKYFKSSIFIFALGILISQNSFGQKGERKTIMFGDLIMVLARLIRQVLNLVMVLLRIGYTTKERQV